MLYGVTLCYVCIQFYCTYIKSKSTSYGADIFAAVFCKEVKLNQVDSSTPDQVAPTDTAAAGLTARGIPSAHVYTHVIHKIIEFVSSGHQGSNPIQ